MISYVIITTYMSLQFSLILSLMNIYQLLQKDPSKRLGSGANGGDEIRSHRWFKGINWKKLERREIQPSFKPVVGGKECFVNIAEEWTKMPILDSPATSPRIGENKQNLFKDFDCII